MLVNRGYYEIEEIFNVINGVLKVWLEHDNAENIRIFSQPISKGIEIKGFAVYHPTEKPWLTEITLTTSFSTVYVQYVTTGDIIEADDINILNEKAHVHNNKEFIDRLNQGVIDEKADKDHIHRKEDITDFPSSLPAADVYDWAKQSEKPKYTAEEIEGIGNIENLQNAGNIVEAVNMAFISADEGKDKISSSLVGKNINVPENPTFQQLSDCINNIQMGTDTSDATAAAAEIITEKTAYVNGSKLTGTMLNNPATTYTLPVNGSYTIPKGYHSGTGKVTQTGVQVGVDTSDATATAGGIIFGKTAYVNGSKLTGTMPSNAAVTYTLPVNGSYTIPKGYHSGTGKVTQTGVQVGVDTSSATATAAGIIFGKTAYVDGSKLTGTMPSNAAVTYTLPVNGSYTIPKGYHSGAGKVKQTGIQQLVIASGTIELKSNGSVTIATGLNKVYCVVLDNGRTFGVITQSQRYDDDLWYMTAASEDDQFRLPDISYGEITAFTIPYSAFPVFNGSAVASSTTVHWIAYGN